MDPAAIGRQVDLAIDDVVAALAGAEAGPVEIVVVSSLAEGADRLVTECVLDRPGGRLEVVLPFDPAEYERDFTSDASRQEFRRLLQRSSRTTTLRPTDRGSGRASAYLDAGKEVADRADVVIAVWDGLGARGPGGTAEIVDYVRQAGRPLVHVAANGAGRGFENLEATSRSAPAGHRGFTVEHERLRNTAEAAARARSRADLLGPCRHWPLPLEDLLAWAVPPLARADTLARRYQRKFLRRAAAAFTLAALDVAIVAYQLVWDRSKEVVWGEVAALGVACYAVASGRRQAVHERWITYRSLSERLRNGFYLALVGCDEYAADAPRPPLGEDDRDDVKAFLARAWIAPQRMYFARHARNGKRHHRQFNAVVYALFGAGFACAVLHAALDIRPEWLHHAITFASITIPAVGAAVGGYAALREYPRHTRRFELMDALLEEADRTLDAARTMHDIRAWAADVDRLLRQEHGDWFGVVSAQDLELPA